LATGLVVAEAHAEEPTSPAAAPVSADASAGSDIVRLNNGGLIRGKISELIPGDSVTIVSIAGKTRDFKMSEVAYAGPADKDPQAPAKPEAAVSAPASEGKESADKSTDSKGYVTVHGQEARLHLVSDEPGLTFHRQVGSAVAVGPGGAAFARGFERICTAPCDVSLPAGTETLAISRLNGSPVIAESVTIPAGNSEVRGRFQSRAGLNIAGWVIAGASLVGGGLLLLNSFGTKQSCSMYSGCVDDPTLNGPMMLSGVVILCAGVPIGIGMGLVGPKPIVEVNPSSGAAANNRSVARGLTLHGSF
jgi:hypothetical protein